MREAFRIGNFNRVRDGRGNNVARYGISLAIIPSVQQQNHFYIDTLRLDIIHTPENIPSVPIPNNTPHGTIISEKV